MWKYGVEDDLLIAMQNICGAGYLWCEWHQVFFFSRKCTQRGGCCGFVMAVPSQEAVTTMGSDMGKCVSGIQRSGRQSCLRQSADGPGRPTIKAKLNGSGAALREN